VRDSGLRASQKLVNLFIEFFKGLFLGYPLSDFDFDHVNSSASLSVVFDILNEFFFMNSLLFGRCAEAETVGLVWEDEFRRLRSAF
jgi:hypothetical protein